MVLFGNQKVTVWNRHFDNLTEEETWLPTVLTRVNLVVTKGANVIKSGLQDADKAKLFLDKNSCGKGYITPKKFELLSLEEKKMSYTFTPSIDFYVKGDTSSVAPATSGFFEYMLNHYDDVYKVTTCDVYEDVMPHLEVGGK